MVINCTVRNGAGPDGDEVLQVYHRAGASVVAFVNGSHPIPRRALVDFTRIGVRAGTTVPVSFRLLADDVLTLTNDLGARVLYPGTHLLDVYDGSGGNVTVAVEWPGSEVVAGHADRSELTGTTRTPKVVAAPPLPPGYAPNSARSAQRDSHN